MALRDSQKNCRPEDSRVTSPRARVVSVLCLRTLPVPAHRAADRLAADFSLSRVTHVIGQTFGPACEMEITAPAQDEDDHVMNIELYVSQRNVNTVQSRHIHHAATCAPRYRRRA